MTTVHQFVAGHDGGGGAPLDRIDTLTIGGTAALGDWLLVVTTGVAGAWDEVPVISDDEGGTAGWTVAFDQTLTGGENLRAVGFKKLCAGGETTITTTWSGPVNHVSVGAWLDAPTLPDLVFLSAGNDGPVGGNLQFRNTAPIPNDGATYVGGVAWGNSNATNANFAFDPPSPPAEGGVGFTTAGDGAGGIQHYNDNETGTTADNLVYEFAPTSAPRVIMYWWATAAASIDVELAGAGTFGLGGTGELDAMGGLVELAGDGTFGLGGVGSILTEGGDAHLAGDGTLGLGGRGFLSAPFPHPVPGPPDLADTLECGIYEALVFTRGLGEIVGMLPFGEVDWARVLDGVSTASLNVDGVANRSQLQKCCQLLGEVEPFEHELAIYRNGYRVWSGPITAMSFPPNQIQISAFDLSGWLQRRTLHEDWNAVQIDLIDIWIGYVQDAMSVDNSPGLHPTALALSGILADRLTQITEHNVALDAIGELERTGIDWTTIDRVMQAGPVLTQPPPITDALEFPLLIDESFRVAPTILLDGMQGANCWYVQGGAQGSAGAIIFGEYGPEFAATPDHVAQPAAPDYQEIEDQYGRLESVTSESRVLDQPSIDDNAKSRYQLTKRPIAAISEGLLLPSAPIAMRKLVPGSLVQVHLANACKPVGDIYRIKGVKVQARADGSEDVNVEFQPLGTGTVLGTGDA